MPDKEQMEQRIVAMIVEVTGEPALAEERELDLFEAGLLDSMAAVELIVRFEEEFRIEIPPTALDGDRMNSVGGIIAEMLALAGAS